MPILKLQVAIAQDTDFPRDRLVITPHFQVNGPFTDADQLCEDLATAIASWTVPISHEVTVTSFDAQGTKPVYHNGQRTVGVGNLFLSDHPREVACCLSYYADQNVPRRRGRLYVPAVLMGAGPLGARPSGPLRTKVAGLVPIFAALGGANVDWVVYSPTDDAAHKVTNWWIDDEWDTVRSRGMRPTTRTTGTTAG